MKIKWEYRIKKFTMPSDWEIGKTKWADLQTTHFYEMSELGEEGWEYIMNIGPLFYFKRPSQEREHSDAYSYETVQDGYVIFGPNNVKVTAWDVVRLLNQYMESRSFAFKEINKEGI